MNSDTLAQRLHAIAHGGDRCAYGGINCSVWRKISEELTMPNTDTGILDDTQINTALREQLARQKPRMFPIQRGVPVRRELAEKAYATYSRLFGEDQSLERLAQRGGFGVEEFACLYLGHDPRCKDRKACAAKVEAETGFIAQLQSQLAQVTQERNDLRRHVTDLNHDLEATNKHFDEVYRRAMHDSAGPEY